MDESTSLLTRLSEMAREFESLTFRKVHGKVRWYVYHQANGLLTTGKSEASKVASGLGWTSSRKMETVA